jgi:hypothetical protein
MRQDKEVESKGSAVATSPEQAPMQHRSQVVASPYEELFDLLQSARKHEALEVLHRIRQGHNVHTILRKAKEANPVAQPSLVSGTRRQYQFSHRSYFPRFLKITDNSYLGSHIYKAAYKDPSSPHQMQVQASDKQN